MSGSARDARIPERTTAATALSVREAPLLELWPQLAVLLGMTAAFLAVTRLLARRWETV